MLKTRLEMAVAFWLERTHETSLELYPTFELVVAQFEAVDCDQMTELWDYIQSQYSAKQYPLGVLQFSAPALERVRRLVAACTKQSAQNPHFYEAMVARIRNEMAARIVGAS